MVKKVIESPIGNLRLTVSGGYLVGLEFLGDDPGELGDSSLEKDPVDSSLMERAVRELEQYFSGKLREFTVPVKVSGTPFQKRVWDAMTRIGYGETLTYQGLAEKAGSPKASRAVGGVCAANPVAIVVPCHRVVAKNGLGGFGGGLDTKKWLLAHEKKGAM